MVVWLYPAGDDDFVKWLYYRSISAVKLAQWLQRNIK